MTTDTTTTLIATAKKNAASLAMAAMLAEHLHDAGFGISSIDEEGVRVFLTDRKVTSAEVQAAIPAEAAPYVQVFEDYIRPEDLVLVLTRLTCPETKGNGTMNHNQTLLKTRRDERVDEARELLKRLAARLDEEAAMTKYDWGDVGSLGDLVDRLRELGPYWVGDKASEDW
jgi:hypothetical protein